MGALIRALEQQNRLNPELRHERLGDALDHIEKAIVILCSLHIEVNRKEKDH